MDAPLLSSSNDDDYLNECGKSSYHPDGSVGLYIVHSSDWSEQVVAPHFDHRPSGLDLVYAFVVQSLA